MKNLVLTLAVLACSGSFAKESKSLILSGVSNELVQHKKETLYTIVYEKKVKIDEEKLSKFPEHVQVLARKQMEQPSYYLLKTTAETSSYKVVSDENNIPAETTSMEGGVRKTKSTVVTRIEELYYKDLTNKRVYLESGLEKKSTVVDYSAKGTIKWTFEKDTKEIGGYEAKKASYTDNGVQVVAWYIPQLAISNGPEFYQGLPGLIVEVETDRVSLVMKQIKQSEGSVVLPSFSNVQSLADYEKQLERMRKPIQDTSNNENGVIRKTRVIRSDM